MTRSIDAAARLLRRAIPRSSALGDRLRRWRHRLAKRPPATPVERLVEAFGRSHPRASFVQVGSNDGVRYDPICAQVRTRPWTGIMVEPVPHLFERLQAHYGSNRRIRLESSAVADHDATQPFWFLADAGDDHDGLPDWYDLLGSFRRDVVLSHRDEIPDIEARLRVIDVPCLTFESLCRKHAVERIDLVHIDTEGYDFEVIKLIDLERWQPAAVLFEHKHLSDDDRAACAAHLAAHGYELYADDSDTFCLRRSSLEGDPTLAAVWRSVSR